LGFEEEDWRQFADCEATPDGVIGTHRMIAICAYSLDKCEASEIMDTVNSHELAFGRRFPGAPGAPADRR